MTLMQYLEMWPLAVAMLAMVGIGVAAAYIAIRASRRYKL
jgi:hypothetical protein